MNRKLIILICCFFVFNAAAAYAFDVTINPDPVSSNGNINVNVQSSTNFYRYAYIYNTDTYTNRINYGWRAFSCSSYPSSNICTGSGTTSFTIPSLPDGNYYVWVYSYGPPYGWQKIRFTVSNCLMPTSGMSISGNVRFCPGTYFLTSGLTIGASNTHLDCNGAVLRGTGSGNGIYSYHKNDIIIQNCNIQHFYYGLMLYSSTNSQIFDNIFDSNNIMGIYSYMGNLTNFSSNTILGSQYGSYYYNSNNNQIYNNNISGSSRYGLYMYNSNSNNLISNTICGSTYNDIRSYYGTNNGVNNKCDNYYGFNDVGITGCTNHCITSVDTDMDGYDIASDCNDNNAAIHPGAVEVCNGIDDNCDAAVDEGQNLAGCTIYYRDSDRDGHGVASDARCLCNGVSPYDSALSMDCNDSNGSIHPGANELCDGKDNDCNTNTLADCNCGVQPMINGVYEVFYGDLGLGGEIIVADADGKICGRSSVDNEIFLINVYGDDPYTVLDEGPIDGEEIGFYFYCSKVGTATFNSGQIYSRIDLQ
ncbi:MAG: MopE-related protein [Nanoarchaeota archaeon]